MTINPGGGKFEPPKWSVEEGSAYAIESWKGFAAGREKLQKQVLRMFEVIGVAPESVLSGYLVPFRSRDWASLPRKTESLEFGVGLWREAFKRADLQTIIAFGKDIGPHMVDLLAARSKAKREACWGAQTIDTYRFGSSGKLLILPHLSRFALFKRSESESAFLAAAAD